MPSDIFIKSSSSTWSKLTNLFIKTGSSTWSAAKSVWLYFDAGWTRVWPLSGIYSLTSPYIANSSGSTTPRTSPVRVGTAYFGKNGTWEPNGWTITGYSYKWIYYTDSSSTSVSSESTLTTYTAPVSNTISALYDRTFISFYVQANASNSAYNGYAESGTDYGRLPVIRNQPLNLTKSLSSYFPTIGSQLTYSSTWDTTSAYASESNRTTVVWYRNSVNSTSGGTQVGTGLIYTPVSADLNNFLYVVETRFNSGTDYDLGLTTGVSVFEITTSRVGQALNPPTSVNINSVSRATDTTTDVSISFSGGTGPYYQLYWISSPSAPVTALYDAASTGSPILETFGFANGITYYFYVRSSTENLGNTITNGSATSGTYSAYSTASASYTFQSPSGATSSISGSSSVGSTLSLSTSSPTTASPAATGITTTWRIANGGTGGNSFTGGSVIQNGGSTYTIPSTLFGTSTVGYQVRAEVTYNNGVGSQTAISNAITITSGAPGTPTSLTATTDRTDGVNLTFSGSTNATSYDIFWNTAISATPQPAATPDFSGVSSPYLDTTISSGVTRYYWVRGKNANGTSAWFPATNGVTGTRTVAIPNATAPTSVNASAGNGTVSVSWSGATNAVKYRVWWSSSSTGNGVDPASSYDAETTATSVSFNLANGTTYYFWVSASNTNNVWTPYSSSPRGQATPTAPPVVTAPTTPTGLTISYASGPTWTGSWTASTGTAPITYYWTLQQSLTNGGAITASASGTTTGTSFSRSMTSSNGLWARFTVYAGNSAGNSGTATSGWA